MNAHLKFTARLGFAMIVARNEGGDAIGASKSETLASDENATGQPHSSCIERFACKTIADAIRKGRTT